MRKAHWGPGIYTGSPKREVDVRGRKAEASGRRGRFPSSTREKTHRAVQVRTQPPEEPKLPIPLPDMVLLHELSATSGPTQVIP